MSWKTSLFDPFNKPGAHIPDNETNKSGIVRSRTLTSTVLGGQTGSSTQHYGGFIFWPHPNTSVTAFGSSAVGGNTMVDLNTTGTGATANVTGPTAATNINTFGDTYRVRLTAMGVRIRYEGTELERAGNYVVGLAPVQYNATTVSTTGTQLSPMSCLFGNYAAAAPYSTSLIKEDLKNLKVMRVVDGDLEIHWIPNGVPSYQGGTNSNANFLLPTTTTGGNSVSQSLWSCDVSNFGVAIGSNVLVVLIENDTTASASASGNAYTVELIQHWEMIPSTIDAVSYPLTPSTSSPSELSQAMNSVSVVGDICWFGVKPSPVRKRGRVKSVVVETVTPRGRIRLVSAAKIRQPTGQILTPPKSKLTKGQMRWGFREGGSAQ